MITYRISQDVTELKQSLEFTQEQMKEEINKIKKDLKDFQQDLLDPKYVSLKLIELEDWSRRNNLGIDGIDQKPNETWDECEARVQELIDVNLGITDTIEFERCHRNEFSQKSESFRDNNL